MKPGFLTTSSRAIQVASILLLVPLLSVLSHEDGRCATVDPIPMARGYLDWFHKGDLEPLVACIVDPSFTLSELRAFRERVALKLGTEKRLVSERYSCGEDSPKLFRYVRYSKYSRPERLVRTVFGFDESDRINEFSIEVLDPEAPSKHSKRKTICDFRLPFRGAWYVAWGGRTMDVNNHAGSRDQRFAYDFTVKVGCSFRSGDGRRNEDYYSYGQEILAPGEGVVVSVVNDVPENEVGSMGPGAGNRVVIDHGHDEYSFLCHLMLGSVTVEVGDRVAQGELIGRCGNSGHSTAPGLHFHLQNSPILFVGDGLPAQFQGFFADSMLVERGEPQGGQTIWSR